MVDDASIDLIEELRRDLPLRPLRTELVAAGLRLIVSVHVEAPVLVQRHAAIHAHIVQLAQHGEQQRRVLDADLQVALQDTESRHQRTEGALDLNAQPALPEVEAVVLDGEPFALERRQNRVAAVGRTGVRVIGADPRVAVVDRMVGVGEDLTEPGVPERARVVRRATGQRGAQSVCVSLCPVSGIVRVIAKFMLFGTRRKHPTGTFH